MRFPLMVMTLVLVATACGGGDSSNATTRAPDAAPETEVPTSMATTTIAEPTSNLDPPWGLDTIVMPDSPKAIEALFAALPGELGGQVRQDVPGRFEGAHAVEYGSWIRTLRATPISAVTTATGRELTPLEWLEMMAAGVEGDVEDIALDADTALAWIASAEQADEETAYLAAWCVPGDAWYFEAVADSPAARLELIESFIAAATQG